MTTFELDERTILEQVLQLSESDPELQVTAVESAPACGQGDNFMSSVSRLVVTVETVKRYSAKRCLLMKRQFGSQERRDAMRTDPAFRNEAAAYKSLIPALEEFTGARLPFPEVVHASSSCVIMTDLKQEGFTMADRRKGLDFLQASLALKELGKFHGVSLAMKYAEPKKFNHLKSEVQEIVFIPSGAPTFSTYLENSLNMALRGLQIHGVDKMDILAPVMDKLEGLKGSLFEKMFNIVCSREPLAVFCHGDFYLNNMLFRKNEMSIPEEVCFVDLQVCRYSSPSTDLLYLFGSSLERGLLGSHFQQLLQIYYSGLEAELSRVHPSSVDKITFEDIKAEVKRNALFGLIMGFLLLPAVTAKPGSIDTDRETIPDIEECLSFLSPEYYERLVDLVLTFHSLGFI